MYSFPTPLMGVRVPPAGRARGSGGYGDGHRTEPLFSRSKVPLASWVTLGRENEVKAASSREKSATIETAMAE